MSEQIPFRVKAHREGDRTVVSVLGEMDIATADAFATELRAELESAPVLLDLSGLTFMDSAGVRALDSVLRELDEHQWDLRIDRPLQSGVEQVLRMTGLLDSLRR